MWALVPTTFPLWSWFDYFVNWNSVNFFMTVYRHYADLVHCLRIKCSAKADAAWCSGFTDNMSLNLVILATYDRVSDGRDKPWLGVTYMSIKSYMMIKSLPYWNSNIIYARVYFESVVATIGPQIIRQLITWQQLHFNCLKPNIHGCLLLKFIY